MDQEEREKMLVDIHGMVKVLDERTEDFKEVTALVQRNHQDIVWIKRIIWAVVPATGFVGAVVTGVVRTFSF